MNGRVRLSERVALVPTSGRSTRWQIHVDGKPVTNQAGHPYEYRTIAEARRSVLSAVTGRLPG